MPEPVSYQCGTLVVGAGPAGIAAATLAAEGGQRVVLIDDNTAPGGQIWRAQAGGEGSKHAGSRPSAWLARLQASGAIFISNTRFIARSGAAEAICERGNSALHIRYSSLILATGARELFLPFPGWTLPNVMGAGGLQAMVKSGMPINGKRVVIAGSGPLLLAVASTLKRKGAIVQGVFEQAPLERMFRFALSLASEPATAMEAIGYLLDTGVDKYRLGWWPLKAGGDVALKRVVLTDGAQERSINCDYLACGFHLIPNIELASMLNCEIRNGRVMVDEFQETSEPSVYCAGEATGVGGLELALIEGEIAGLSCCGNRAAASKLHARLLRLRRRAARMNAVFAPRQELQRLATDDCIVCRCEDVDWKTVRAYNSSRSAKLHTRCGMGPCQGRVCGPALRFLRGWELDRVRSPLYPALVSSLLPKAAEKEHQ